MMMSCIKSRNYTLSFLTDKFFLISKLIFLLLRNHLWENDATASLLVSCYVLIIFTCVVTKQCTGPIETRFGLNTGRLVQMKRRPS